MPPAVFDDADRTAFCTIVARNYLAHARVLARSLRRSDPRAGLDVLVLDDPRGEVGEDEPFRVLRPDDVGLGRDFLELATAYDTLELATSVKAALLRAELDTAGAAVYLDPDIAVLHRLDGLGPLAREHGIVVTPHCRQPIPADGHTPDEAVFLRAGTFNLGFLAVGQAGRPMLEWWDERLRRDCVHAVDEGLFVDQKWLDLAAGHFDLHVLDDPGYNVAYWNVHERPVRTTDAGYYVGDVPLRFFHFSGYDVSVPHRLSRHAGERPRQTLADAPAVRELCDWYRAELLEAGHAALRATPPLYERTANGLPVDRRMRRVYRAARNAAAPGAPAPRPPFGDARAADDFLAWLREPVVNGATADVSRYAMQLWLDRPDIRFHFPDLHGRDSGRYADWLRGPGARQVGAPDALVPPAAAAPRWPRPETLRPGVNVVGYVRAESGVGEAARGLATALAAAEIPHTVVPYTDTPVRQRHPFEASIDPPHHAVTVCCVNADETPRFVERYGDQLLDGRWRVGMWAWEVDRMPVEYAAAAEALDEVWVGSEHTARAVRAAIDLPVHVLPLAVDTPPPPPATRADLGLPAGFLVLFCFDFASVAARKNPYAVLDAFTRAFPDDADARLVFKTVGGDRYRDELDRLRLATAADPRVTVSDGYLTREEHLALVATADAYVSLHRSEGFGLTMAEAMALGRPVVATAYSGNLEFMDESTAWLVPYELVPVGPGHAPYPEDAVWADPDVDAAARALRDIRDDPAAAARRARAGRTALAERHSPAARAAFLRERVDAALAALAAREEAARRAEAAQAPEPTADLGTVRELVAAGPDVDAPARSRASKVVRKVVARAIDNFASHQRRVDTMLATAVEEADARRAAGQQSLDRQIADLRAGVAGSARELAALRASMTRIGQLERAAAELTDELSAEPHRSSATAFRVVDGGRTVIGYDDADGVAPEDSYAWFTDAFRGSEAALSARLRCYVPLLCDAGPVFEVGPGRGELLTLLHQAGVPARGVELDATLAARCRARGLDVVHGDGITALGDVPPGTLGAVVAIELVEHLSPTARDDLLAAAHRALCPGGLLLLETVNPHSARALKAFWLDPTHVRPLYPEGLVTVVRSHGYASARVSFTGGTGDLDVDRTRSDSYYLVARTGAG